MLFRKIRWIVADESGVTAVEYALMLGLIILVCISGIGAMGGANQAYWQSSVDSLTEIFSK